MSQIITFSIDKEFAGRLEGFIQQTGYNNRSLFLRDASIHFADVSIRGDLESIDENRHVEGTAVVYFQHNVEHKIAELRHSEQFQITGKSGTTIFFNSLTYPNTDGLDNTR